MLIQEEAPRPANPLATFDEDYDKAVLHLAWDQLATANERTLLFAMVELLPVEVPPPLDDGKQAERLGGADEHSIHLRRVVAPARRALAWYLDCRRGIAVLPDQDGQLPTTQEARATKLQLADLGEHPPWPTLVCHSGESNTVPFCPPWHAFPRVHHLVPLADLDLGKLWPEAGVREKAGKWLENRLHFSLEQYPEYWGSVHLVALNPVYRTLDARLQSRMSPRESVLLRFEPRAGKCVEGLEMTFTEKSHDGPLDVRHVVVQRPLLRLDFERKVGANKRDVFDPRRGLLEAWHSAYVFLTGVSVNVVSTRRGRGVQLNVPGPAYDAGADDTGLGDPGNAPKIASAHERLFAADAARKKRNELRRRKDAAAGGT